MGRYNMEIPTKVISQRVGVGVEIQKGPDEITTYANIVGITFGPDEVILHFGLRSADDPNKGTGVAKIYINSAHAKRLTAALGAAVQQVESIFGEIIADPASKLTPEKLQELQKLAGDKNE